MAEALAHHGAGRLAQAEQLYRRILDARPEHAEALHYLGVVALQTGRADEAVSLIRRASSLQPGRADVLVNLGAALQAAGETEAALQQYEDALVHTPHAVNVIVNAANALMQLGRMDEAVARYEQALASAPQLSEARRCLADALLRQQRPEAALPHARQVVAEQPQALSGRVCLANALHAVGQLDEAIAAFEAVLQKAPTAVPVLCNLSNVLRDAGRAADARTRLQQAIDGGVDHADMHYSLALACTELGDRDAAAHAFRAALARDPLLTRAWRGLASLSTHAVTDAELDAMGATLARTDLAPPVRMHLEYALGKALEDRAQYDQAFGHFHAANTLQQSEWTYSSAAEAAAFERLGSVFTDTILERCRRAAVADEAPVFIIGMPRSGTTLVEQILASHPQVHGGGELQLLPRAIAASLPLVEGFDYSASLVAADLAALGTVAGRYLEALQALAPAAPRITDKLPANFLNVGLIATLMPHARIVHCVRDPRDTCLSIYKHWFNTRGHGYACRLQALGEYYGLYAGLMARWQQLFPGRIHTVHYEELVRDLPGQTRTLLEACDLTWDDACLDFPHADRAVATLSASQVREPVHARAIGTWQRYEAHVQPLLQALGSLADGIPPGLAGTPD
jgi:tetratricopeptide (TPR) repeat protein